MHLLIRKASKLDYKLNGYQSIHQWYQLMDIQVRDIKPCEAKLAPHFEHVQARSSGLPQTPQRILQFVDMP